MSVALERPRRRVAVADDNPRNRAQKSRILYIAGFDVIPLEDHYPHVGDLVEAVRRANATALICDHKLTEGRYAGFDGAEAVAELYGSTIPGILVTDYGDSELRHIRKHRSKVPVVIRGSDFVELNIISGINTWEDEVLRHRIPVGRRPRRTLVTIDEIADQRNGGMYTVFVPRWREHEAVLLPGDAIPSEIASGLKKGSKLIASVNTEAGNIDDLYFKDFELVPEEDLADAVP
jgi:CheY-like chemotaxis protein